MELTTRNKTILETALLAGKILMQCGSEADRVEDTMERILINALPSEEQSEIRTFVMLNAIFVGVGPLHTSFLQVKTRSYNLNKITQVNQVSRDFASQKLSLEQVHTALQEIHQQKENPISLKLLLAAGFLGGATAPLFGGVIADAPAAAAAAIVAYLVYNFISSLIDIPFVCEFIAAFLGGVTGILLLPFVGVNINKIMMGAVIPLVPGIAITNSIRDIMRRHYLTGLIRFVECMVIGASLGGGITLVFVLFGHLL